jgi:uncharacterized protein (TIGR02466 family)
MSNNNVNNQLEPFQTFHTPLWAFCLNNEEYHCSDYIDRILEIEKNEQSERKSNVGGFQTRDDLHRTEGIFRELTTNLTNLANEILLPYNCKKVQIVEMWANINDKYSYNKAHTHGGILSGVFYLQTPENSGKIVFLNPAIRSDFHIIRHPHHGIDPKKLVCIFFPSWLEHSVEQSMSDERRISISFNLNI